MPRAILFASATATTGIGLRSGIRASQEPAGAPRREAQRISLRSTMPLSTRLRRSTPSACYSKVEAGAPDPVAERAAIEMQPLPLEDPGLTVKRKVVAELRDDDPRGQPLGW